MYVDGNKIFYEFIRQINQYLSCQYSENFHIKTMNLYLMVLIL